MRRIRWSLILALLLSAMLPLSGLAVTVNYDSSSGLLPSDLSISMDQRFPLSGMASFATINSGVLEFDDNIVTASVAFSQNPTFGSNWVFEARVRVLSHSRSGLDYAATIGVRDGVRSSLLVIADDNFGLVNEGGGLFVGDPVLFDSTDGFHTYLVRKDGPTVTVSVDGTPMLSVPYANLDLAPGGVEQLFLGATSSLGTMSWDLTHFAANTDGIEILFPVPAISPTGLMSLIVLVIGAGVFALRRPREPVSPR